MKIRLITARVMVGISAVILILSVINWVRSSLLHETDDLVYVGASGGYALTSADGVVALGKSSGWGSRPGWFYRHDNAGGAFWDWWRCNPSAGGNDLQLLGIGVFYTHNGSRFFGSIQMPYWLIVLAASISPAWPSTPGFEGCAAGGNCAPPGPNALNPYTT